MTHPMADEFREAGEAAKRSMTLYTYGVKLLKAAAELDRQAEEIKQLELLVKGYEEWGDDVKRLTRMLDVAICGEEGAAKQASLCDLVGPVKEMAERIRALEAENEKMREALQAEPEKWSFDVLVLMSRAILAKYYPASVFDGSSGDGGPQLIVALRSALSRLEAPEVG